VKTDETPNGLYEVFSSVFLHLSVSYIHGEHAFAMEGKSEVTTRIFGYIQYIPRNNMYPVCIQWVLATMTTLVNRGVLVPCDNKATRLHGY